MVGVDLTGGSAWKGSDGIDGVAVSIHTSRASELGVQILLALQTALQPFVADLSGRSVAPKDCV